MKRREFLSAVGATMMVHTLPAAALPMDDEAARRTAEALWGKDAILLTKVVYGTELRGCTIEIRRDENRQYFYGDTWEYLFRCYYKCADDAEFRAMIGPNEFSQWVYKWPN